jgi:hypothetical protein
MRTTDVPADFMTERPMNTIPAVPADCDPTQQKGEQE